MVRCVDQHYHKHLFTRMTSSCSRTFDIGMGPSIIDAIYRAYDIVTTRCGDIVHATDTRDAKEVDHDASRWLNKARLFTQRGGS